MTSLKKILCCFALIACTTASQAKAWHGFGCNGFTGYGYGFGLNHQSFRPSIYNPGWSSYSRASFYSSYGLGGLGYASCWPRSSYYVSYRSFAPVFYTNYSYCAPTYFAPTYYVPSFYNSYYTPYVSPVIYSSYYSSFPTCSATPSVSSLPVAAYSVKKPVANSAPFRLASQPVPPAIQPQAPVGRYVLAQATSAAMDSAPEDLIAAADAILAAGGFRQAAQAYAQIVVKHGNSDRLVTRRFVAQVANGDFEQAAVVVELAVANGNRINPSDLPRGNLQVALGNQGALITTRSESLAANALEKLDDSVPMLCVAHWLELSGDNERANLFKARAEQMKQVEVGKLVSTSVPTAITAN